MLLDPKNLGLDGFEQIGPEAGQATLDLSVLDPGVAPEDLVVRKRVQLPVSYHALRIEGPSFDRLEVMIDDVRLVRGASGTFALPPAFGGHAILELRFKGSATPVTGLWVVP